MNKNKILFFILIASVTYILVGVLLQVFVFKTAYTCPFRYGACGIIKIESIFSWLGNILFWPIELLLFVVYSQPGVELPL